MKLLIQYLRLLPLLLLLALPLQAVGQQKSAEVQRLERQRRSIQEAIERVNKLLDKASSDARSGFKQLQLLESQVAAREKVVKTMEAEVAAIGAEIARLEVHIAELEAQFRKRQGSYVKSLQAMQRTSSGGNEDLLFILSAKDFAEGARRARYLAEYAAWQRREGEKLRAMQQELEAERTKLVAQKQTQEKLLQERTEELQKLEEDKRRSDAEVKKLQGRRKELQQELKKQKRQAAALNKQIEEQIAREVEEARRRSQKSGTEKRKATQKGGYAMTDEELKLSDNFAENKGKLPAPISGNYHVVARFGLYSPKGLKHVQVNNGGIDLQGAPGAEARAVFKGKVTKIFVVDGFNNSIIVRHGNYLTVYSNITNVYVRTGDAVQTGQALGKIYSDPDLGGATRLHFQLWKERTKQNPEHWLR